MNYILYHTKNTTYCLDGLASAAVVKFALLEYGVHDKDIKLIPVRYNEPFPDLDLHMDDNVYIVDFSYAADKIKTVAEKVNRLVIIDHHESASGELGRLNNDLPDDSNITVVFSTNSAGCVLAWRYFYPEKIRPLCLLYIGDRDTWAKQYEASEAYCMWLFSMGENEIFNTLLNMFRLSLDNISARHINTHQVTQESSITVAKTDQYMPIIKHRDEAIAAFVADKGKSWCIKDFNGLKMGFFNNTHLISEYAEGIYNSSDVDFVCSYEFSVDGKLSLNFRSAKTTGINVIGVAKMFGGGGHPNAAGATIADTKQAFKVLEEFFNLSDLK